MQLQICVTIRWFQVQSPHGKNGQHNQNALVASTIPPYAFFFKLFYPKIEWTYTGTFGGF